MADFWESILLDDKKEVSPKEKKVSYKKPLLFLWILILAILPVVFFLTSLRTSDTDITRIAHLSLLKERVDEALKTGKNIPLPSNSLELSFGEIKIGYLGKAGEDLYTSLWLDYLSDPETGEEYNYFIRPETNEYEFLALLNENKYANYFIWERPAYSLGTSKGNMLVINKGKNQGKLVSSILTSKQKVDLKDEEKREQIWWEAYSSCSEIIKKQPQSSSWRYVINIDKKLLTVYCDMKTDGWWWTLFYANNGHSTSALKLSYIQLRESFESNPIDKIWDYDNPNLVGLINYNHFTSNWSKEILARNRTWEPTRWIKFTFSSAWALNWALWSRVLGNTSKWCTDLPWNETWSIISNDGKIKYDKLESIMNHKWISWWVSHQSYWCNDVIWNASPHIAFYVAWGITDDTRARWNEGIWWAFWGENEYRYFIR